MCVCERRYNHGAMMSNRSTCHYVAGESGYYLITCCFMDGRDVWFGTLTMRQIVNEVVTGFMKCFISVKRCLLADWNVSIGALEH